MILLLFFSSVRYANAANGLVFHSLSQRHRNLILLVYVNNRMFSSTQQRGSYIPGAQADLTP